MFQDVGLYGQAVMARILSAHMAEIICRYCRRRGYYLKALEAFYGLWIATGDGYATSILISVHPLMLDRCL